MIDFDLPCASCSYNVRGLSANARCPECDCPIAETLSTRISCLSGFEHARIKSSALLIIASIAGAGGVLCMLVVLNAFFFLDVPAVLRLGARFALAAFPICLWLAIARLTTVKGVRATFFSACAMGAGGLSAVVSATRAFAGAKTPAYDDAGLLAITLLSAVCVAGVAGYLRALAQCLNSRKLGEYARDAAICVPIATIALVCAAWICSHKGVQAAVMLRLAVCVQILAVFVLAVVVLLVLRGKIPKRDLPMAPHA
ncbi:MAG: hypothetical protein KBH81_05060 [Phycisphaerae bacterium]|mgnify:CR=1 FL=1|jgi:hypothetical protein|nr:hypothetical protein [Phycisphaerae bacterium]